MENLSSSAKQSIGAKGQDTALSGGTILGASSVELLGSLDTGASYKDSVSSLFIYKLRYE
jgi:hypothetical protein